jgi:prepilin-type processing-associated H-X9-DG protein/prepilin-type N-terminal cleavage/methylation domain-containing protein
VSALEIAAGCPQRWVLWLSALQSEFADAFRIKGTWMCCTSRFEQQTHLQTLNVQKIQNNDSSGLAFTLIELLVVIAVIGVLAGLLLSALSQAKARVKSAHCTNNLRQMGMAMKMYEADYDYYPSTESVLYYAPGRSGLQVVWWQQLLPYVSSNLDTLYCVANPQTFRITNASKGNFETYPFEGYSYGINSHGTGYMEGTPNLGLQGYGFRLGGPDVLNGPGALRDSEIASPSNMIEIGDSQSDHLNDFAITTMRIPFGNSIKGQSWPGNRHRKGANIVFVDGHVENASQKKWLEKAPETRRRWNFDNEPHPETWTDTLTPP